MARKIFGSGRNSSNIKPLKSTPRGSSPVRSTPLPKSQSQSQKKPITHEMIAQRAYFISISGNGGSEFDNWIRAEQELRGY